MTSRRPRAAVAYELNLSHFALVASCFNGDAESGNRHFITIKENIRIWGPALVSLGKKAILSVRPTSRKPGARDVPSPVNGRSANVRNKGIFSSHAQMVKN